MGLEGFKAMTYQEQLDMKADNERLKLELATAQEIIEHVYDLEREVSSYKMVGVIKQTITGLKVSFAPNVKLEPGQVVYMAYTPIELPKVGSIN